MRIRIIAVSEKVPVWVETHSDEYLKRLQSDCPIGMHVIPAIKRAKNISLQKVKALEADLILNTLRDNTFCVLLDERGKQYSSIEFSHQFKAWQEIHGDISFIIGGADGFHESVYQRANAKWSLSQLTYPHPLVRVILAEQLYRAVSIAKGHPYHRE